MQNTIRQEFQGHPQDPLPKIIAIRAIRSLNNDQPLPKTDPRNPSRTPQLLKKTLAKTLPKRQNNIFSPLIDNFIKFDNINWTDD